MSIASLYPFPVRTNRWRRVTLAMVLALVNLTTLLRATAFAQYPRYPIPFEASVGLGVLEPTAGALVGGLSWDYDEGWWAVPVIEGEFNTLTESRRCQLDDPPDSCLDAAILAGFRLRPVPHRWSGVRPFAQVMMGQYWKGSGLDDVAYAWQDLAVDVGGGIEIRRAGSFQGVRVTIDYRRVFVAGRSSKQMRFAGMYVIGPRRFARRPQ